MIIGIVGSRDYPDLDHVRAVVRRQDPRTEIVSGGARGVDRVVREEAMRLGREFLEIAADRDGTDACQRRNGMIVAIVDQIIAFRYRNSPGTTNVLDQAHAAHK